MKSYLRLFAVSLLTWALAGCVTDYTKSEAPNDLRVNGEERRVELSFVPGSARLTRANAVEQLVATGAIRPADRVTIAVAGSPRLAEERVAAISRQLLDYGIVADTLPLEPVPANRAIIGIGRYTVTLPPCPNWSVAGANDLNNALPSNYGCADAVNLGLMVANPADLVAGQTLAPAAGQPATAAVRRYLTDKVTPLPTESTLGPIAGGGGGAAAGGGGAGGGGEGGAAGGTP